ncbi:MULTISPECIES: hypothetical protein [Streptomyces]|uniref:hypothetical protein n=1 Tax=Streptomyces TaxID=1883 RepID=UPI00163C6047|nr:MULTISPECIES: hypothetical protein [Streptomyces]MBC2878050.1 hypothetical protein [Streptomyces sp. TYQ1024]UBI40001.1 hypothetical protein K7I03_28415 [Streptomyces mobaraensis]UKW32582.1 hypothetical protein MCU78_28345 [Streptomyces sp. TYQ1024]
MAADPFLPEQILALASHITRHNDALPAINLASPAPARQLLLHLPLTQRVAHEAFDAADALAHQPLHPAPAVRRSELRIRQLAHLITEAAEHLLDAADLLEATRPQGHEPHDERTLALAYQEVRARIAIARDLTALGPDDAVEAAELLGGEMQRQHAALVHPPHALSAAQLAALRAVARGQVTVEGRDDKLDVFSGERRVSSTTLRALEAKHLLLREALPNGSRRQRPHLTAAGRRTLSATFATGTPAPRSPAAPARPAARSTARTR